MHAKLVGWHFLSGLRGFLMGEAANPEGKNYSVFLSYSRNDRDRALPIIEALEAQGYAVWWDGLLKGGQRFASTTETALETADAVVVLWTTRSISSHWVRDEATRGRDRGCMISLSLDGTEPPLGFRQIQYIDFTDWHGDDTAMPFIELAQAVQMVANTPGVELSFSNFKTPRHGFTRRSALVAGGVSIAAVGGGFAVWQMDVLGTAASANSIAVLAFENLNKEPEQIYFSDGLTEELRSTLSLNPQLDVMAETSSNRFRDGQLSAQEIARALNVSIILEGSVRRAGDRIRIVARMVDGADGFEKWTESFERDFDDVLEVQRAIATEVVDALLANLTASTKQTERVGGTRNAKAFDEFLRGSALYDLAKDEETDRAALAAFEMAVKTDPGYAAAYAALSRANTVMASFHASGTELLSYYDRAMAHARKAIDLAPEMAEGHSALGFVLTNGKLDLAGARDPYTRSFELGFGNAAILTGYAIYASLVSDFDGARRAIERAQRLDPLNASVYRTAALAEFAARDFGAARRAARTALSHNAEISAVYRLLGDMELLEGNLKGAQENYLKEPSGLSRLRGLAITRRLTDGEAAGKQALADLQSEYGENSLYQQAQIFAQWNETDRAIDALERGIEMGDSGLILAPTDPMLDPIRHRPEFKAILSRLGV